MSGPGSRCAHPGYALPGIPGVPDIVGRLDLIELADLNPSFTPRAEPLDSADGLNACDLRAFKLKASL
jgi:hypothetical protein